MMRASIGGPPVAVTFTTVGGSQPAPIWPAVVVGVLVIAAALAVAWWRRRSPLAGPPRRRIRIAVSAVAGGSGGALMQLASSGSMSTGAGGIGWDPSSLSTPLVLFAQILGYWLFAAMLVGTTDLLFDVLRPRRSLAWFVVGAPVFAAFIVAILRVTGWTDPLVFPPTRDQATMVVAALAAGLTWWSWLPASWNPVAKIFE